MSLGNPKGLSLTLKKDAILIRFICCVKLHGKHCQIRDKNLIICMDHIISINSLKLYEVSRNLIWPGIILFRHLVIIFKLCVSQK